MSDKPDPTKAPEFQKVIRHFVTTPHKPHAPLKSNKRNPDRQNGSPKGEVKPTKETR
jgi:hypothetical protein